MKATMLSLVTGAIMMLVISPASAELLYNGGFEGTWNTGQQLTNNTATATVDTVTDQGTYLQIDATSALPTYNAWYAHPSHSRTGNFVYVVDGDAGGQKSFITSNIDTSSSTATSLSCEPMSTVPSAGDTFRIYTAKPDGWDRTWHTTDYRMPFSRDLTNPHSGSAALRMDLWGHSTQIQQTLDLEGGTTYTLSYWLWSATTTAYDAGAIIRERVNPSDPSTWTVIENDRAKAAQAGTWEERTLIFTPDHNMSVQVEMGFNMTGAATNAYLLYDDISLTPEPASLILLATGGLALLRRRNR